MLPMSIHQYTNPIDVIDPKRRNDLQTEGGFVPLEKLFICHLL